ncbi:Protein F28H7.3 [Aphelenchoides avenae]|nr:Protein F28H7.3 [Aphelenchus avenae]
MGLLSHTAALSCLVLTAYAAYSDTFARNKMLPLSAAAYSDHPQECLKNSFSNAQLIRNVIVQCDVVKGDRCAGFSAVSHGDRAIIFSFRGTQGFLQLLLEADKTVLAKKVDVGIGGHVSSYFHNVLELLLIHGFEDDLTNLRTMYPDYEIWITGHSLGGSVASLFAAHVVDNKLADPSKIQLYTFGQPRTGDRGYAAAHDTLLPNTYRVTHKRDIVPHVPPENFEGYWHHKDEVWYDNDMKLGQSNVLCASQEGKACSDRNLFDLSISDHLHYFDKYVSSYGVGGCVN